MDWFLTILSEFFQAMAVMAPYLLFGFLVAGLLHVLLPTDFVRRQLGRPGFGSIFKASLLGVPLPLCSCGVIPVTTGLRKSGATRSSSISFLLSTPQTGVDSMLVTYSMLGWVMAIYRPVVALITGVVGGSAVEMLTGREESLKRAVDVQKVFEGDEKEPGAEAKPHKECEKCPPDSSRANKKTVRGKIGRIFYHGFVTLPEDIGVPMLIGLFVAGIISVVVPENFFAVWTERLGSGAWMMLLMLFVGIPMYVCSTASVPIAAALIAKGLSPGAVMVFLMTGPATNAVAVLTISRIMGRKTAFIYIGVVVLCAIGSGLVLNALFPGLSAVITEHMHEMHVAGWEYASAVILLAVLLWGSYKHFFD